MQNEQKIQYMHLAAMRDAQLQSWLSAHAAGAEQVTVVSYVADVAELRGCDQQSRLLDGRLVRVDVLNASRQFPASRIVRIPRPAPSPSWAAFRG